MLERAGDAWANEAGGTSGALWGLGLRTLGARLGDQEPVKAPAAAAGVRDAVDAIQRLGGARVGDKTLIDAMQPFAEHLMAEVEAGKSLREAWQTASHAAADAAKATADLKPKLGRAKNHSDKSVGHPDPGAVSFALITAAAGATLAQLKERSS